MGALLAYKWHTGPSYQLQERTLRDSKVRGTEAMMKYVLPVVLLLVTTLATAKDISHSARNCKDLLDEGFTMSDWYTIYPDGNTPLKVLCDMHTDGGGWIVFQRRTDGSVDFHRPWEAYKKGFGSHLTEFWLGNDNIHQLTSSGTWELRVDLQDFDYNRFYATYSSFQVLGESKNYKLVLGEFTGGDAGNALSGHNSAKFTTVDNDNGVYPTNCASYSLGGWWYTGCHTASLNGKYMPGNVDSTGITWETAKDSYYSFKLSEMKIRPT
ncbi:ficolin-1-like isoform X1 [Hyperolius riggenbachi]|uniref:ficolin-1-like isoform X1 n=1 Tax=Hyperolius riggenbachi TaxID=752182 RepID=UPI0035A2F672